MIDSITLYFTGNSEKLQICTQGVTILVGANNSGKSLALREIEMQLSGSRSSSTCLVKDFEPKWPTLEEFDIALEGFKARAPQEIRVAEGAAVLTRYERRGELVTTNVDVRHLREQVGAQVNKHFVASTFFRNFLVSLDGRTRFELTDDLPRGDLLLPARNMLAHLFKDDPLRARVREIIHDALGVHFTIDALSSDQLRIRLSPTPPPDVEQSLNAEAREFHSRAQYIKTASDGVQAFVGIVCATLSGDYKAILIDEPEAFLHPPLARRLGYELSRNLKEGGSLLAATHSSDFLVGCLQASTNVRVVRLEYSDGESRGRIVDSATLSKMFKTPLFRSTNVISALFHDGVVVTESDNDRAFYAEIYYRLSEQEKGLPSLLFVNAQNKQTIRDLVRPLREFGVPAAAVVDIDILKDGGSDWIQWLKAVRIPNAMHVGLAHLRASLHNIYKSHGMDMKEGGVDQLDRRDQAAAHELFDQLQQYGLFVVRNGELESWLAELGIRSKKSNWTVEMLDRLGGNPTDSTYVRPSEGDVWQFMRSVVAWVKIASRKGVD